MSRNEEKKRRPQSILLTDLVRLQKWHQSSLHDHFGLTLGDNSEHTLPVWIVASALYVLPLDHNGAPQLFYFCSVGVLGRLTATLTRAGRAHRRCRAAVQDSDDGVHLHTEELIGEAADYHSGVQKFLLQMMMLFMFKVHSCIERRVLTVCVYLCVFCRACCWRGAVNPSTRSGRRSTWRCVTTVCSPITRAYT